MDEFDDDLRGRLAGAAEEIGRSDLARTASAALPRAVRRHRRGVAAQAVAATLAVVAAAAFAPRLWTAPERTRVAADGTPSPAPAAPSPTEEPPSPSPEPVASSPSPSPTAVALPSPSPTRSSPPATAEPTPATQWVDCPTRPTRIDPPPKDVNVMLELSSARVAPGGTLKITVSAKNDGSTPVTYKTGLYHSDFWVEDIGTGADTRWLWSAGREFSQHYPQMTLQPGESVASTIEWDLRGCAGRDGAPPRPLPKGIYVAYGFFVSDAENRRGWEAGPVHFEIG